MIALPLQDQQVDLEVFSHNQELLEMQETVITVILSQDFPAGLQLMELQLEEHHQLLELDPILFLLITEVTEEEPLEQLMLFSTSTLEVLVEEEELMEEEEEQEQTEQTVLTVLMVLLELTALMLLTLINLETFTILLIQIVLIIHIMNKIPMESLMQETEDSQLLFMVLQAHMHQTMLMVLSILPIQIVFSILIIQTPH